MLAVPIIACVLLGQTPTEPADLGHLVSRLGSARYTERETASRELESLGSSALPALRSAKSSRDPEIRIRAAGLLRKIEGALLTQATRVRLDYDRAPLTEVVRSLGEQAGFRVTLYPDNLTKWKYQKVTLQRPGTVPFWKAIDLLCDAAKLQPSRDLHGIGGPRAPTFALIDGPAREVTPSFDYGPFRVSLRGIHYERDLSFGHPAIVPGQAGGARRVARPANPPRPGFHPVASEQFNAQIVVAAEPRLFISQTGGLRVTEAVDDQGNSLMIREPEIELGPRFGGHYFGLSNGPVLQLQAPLRRPSEPGRAIAKLRGVIPLLISSRGPDPLVVPLDPKGVGKRFANADVALTVQAIRARPDTPQVQIELSIHSNDRDGAVDDGEPDAFGDVFRPDLQRQQLEIVDAGGRLLSWFPSGADAETSRVTLTVPTAPAAGPLKEIRYHELTRTTMDLPFEFEDIPMP